jgi:hypothetical protein
MTRYGGREGTTCGDGAARTRLASRFSRLSAKVKETPRERRRWKKVWREILPEA